MLGPCFDDNKYYICCVYCLLTCFAVSLGELNNKHLKTYAYGHSRQLMNNIGDQGQKKTRGWSKKSSCYGA